MNSRLLAEIDKIAEEGIREGAYPGCQVVVLKDGREMYNKAFGTHVWNEAGSKALPVKKTDVYDIASLTKTTATLLAVMKLYDGGRLNLTDRVSDYLPFLQDTDKKNITVRELLMHESGLPSTLLFYQEAIDEESYTGTLFKARPDARHSARIGRQTWANPKFRFRQGLTSKVQTPEYTMQVSDSLWLNRSFKQGTCRRLWILRLGINVTVIVVWALFCCSSWSRRAPACLWTNIWPRNSILRWDWSVRGIFLCAS